MEKIYKWEWWYLHGEDVWKCAWYYYGDWDVFDIIVKEGDEACSQLPSWYIKGDEDIRHKEIWNFLLSIYDYT
jgi:hypothetical protein